VAGIAHYQLCERASGDWLLRFVPDTTPPGTAETQALQQRLKRLLGLMREPMIQQTDLIMPESSGKFRLGCPAGNKGQNA